MKLRNKMAVCGLTAVLAGAQLLAVHASNVNNIQQQINQNQNALNQVNNQLSQYEAERDEYLSYLDDQKSEMMNLMKDIAYNEHAISEKEDAISNASTDLEEAALARDEQYEAMMVRIQYMYENGNENYLEMLLGSQDFTDLLNRAEYVDSLYEYDSAMLTNYEKLVSDIQVMRNTLETDKQELLTHQAQLEENKGELDRIMAELQDTISDYDTLVAEAKTQAQNYKNQIAQGQQQIQQMQQQANQKPGGGATVSGTGTGAEIAKFALQHVGNPYVYGGNSLTNGVDCSGFIVQVYKHFNYDLGVRSSCAMRSIGTEVSLKDAKAGDIICYSGHVALYIGDGKIVHAKNSKYGIVTDPVYYGWGGASPTVLTVRRIIN